MNFARFTICTFQELNQAGELKQDQTAAVTAARELRTPHLHTKYEAKGIPNKNIGGALVEFL